MPSTHKPTFEVHVELLYKPNSCMGNPDRGACCSYLFQSSSVLLCNAVQRIHLGMFQATKTLKHEKTTQ